MHDEHTPSELVFEVAKDGSTSISVRLEDQTVWLTQAQIAELFQTTRENISTHIQNVFREGEVVEDATRKDYLLVRQEGRRQVTRNVAHYNLDLILSVGYRVKSAVATKFRIWATDRLRDYLVTGAAVNQARLDELGKVIHVLARSVDELVAGTAEIVAGYLPSLTMIREYDAGSVAASPDIAPTWRLTPAEARRVIADTAAQFPDDNLFGRERGDGLLAVIESIYQSFGGQLLYPTAEEQAANLLYLVVKDHPLSDGNKRSAAALFVTFLSRNGMLREENGVARISNNALAALTLLIAMSAPSEKALMVALVIRMLSGS